MNMIGRLLSDMVIELLMGVFLVAYVAGSVFGCGGAEELLSLSRAADVTRRC